MIAVNVIFDLIANNKDFVELLADDLCEFDIRYSSTNNFMKKNLYNSYKRVFLHKTAYEKFKLAKVILAKKYPGYKFLVFDCFRPKLVQESMWNFLKGTEFESYVASPERGSLHNYGLAMDLTLKSPQGQELDMGTPFDDFSKLSQPRLESEFIAKGEIIEEIIRNRLILKNTMEDSGFTQLPWEWWHFDAVSRDMLPQFQSF